MKNIKSMLAKQLAFFAEHKSNFLDQHFPNAYYSHTLSSQRKKAHSLLSDYTNQIQAFIQQANESGVIDFVTIGCQVILLNEDGSTEEQYTLCFPEESSPEEGKISFLSPVGQQLLLAKIGEEIAIQTPIGENRVKVSKIQMDIDKQK